ncbi:MAG TPA: hypothetical protein VGA80_17350, partial [Flavobacteriaceae bacterium]
MEASASKRIKVYNTKNIPSILDDTLESVKHYYPKIKEWKFRKNRQSENKTKIITSIKKLLQYIAGSEEMYSLLVEDLMFMSQNTCYHKIISDMATVANHLQSHDKFLIWQCVIPHFKCKKMKNQFNISKTSYISKKKKKKILF